MTKFTSFEEIDIWKLARILTSEIYCEFKKSRDFSFRDQIQKSCVSIMNNIAEGYERNTSNEFVHFLKIAKASAGEVKSMLYLSEDLGYLSADRSLELRNNIQEIMKKTGSLIRYLELKKNPRKPNNL